MGIRPEDVHLLSPTTTISGWQHMVTEAAAAVERGQMHAAWRIGESKPVCACKAVPMFCQDCAMPSRRSFSSAHVGLDGGKNHI